jgi:hypothetical protein
MRPHPRGVPTTGVGLFGSFATRYVARNVITMPPHVTPNDNRSAGGGLFKIAHPGRDSTASGRPAPEIDNPGSAEWGPRRGTWRRRPRPHDLAERAGEMISVEYGERTTSGQICRAIISDSKADGLSETGAMVINAERSGNSTPGAFVRNRHDRRRSHPCGSRRPSSFSRRSKRRDRSCRSDSSSSSSSSFSCSADSAAASAATATATVTAASA